MLLRNYDNLCAYLQMPLKPGEKFSTTGFGDGSLCMKTTNGVVGLPTRQGSSENITTPFSRFGISSTDFDAFYDVFSACIVAGSGNTQVNYDDYKLDNMFSDSQVAKIDGSEIYSEAVLENGVWTKTYSVTVLAKEAITVSEIGVLGYCKIPSSDCKLLLYREVLKTPIEVPANSNFVLSFTVKVPTNPNKPANYSASAATE